eukprot:CAMPEP_0113689768 /NCGR_PEP_ID=MMETSP0038_2-20120614/17377_1 /TAXON_ID=2898 /ORGANISM="Cryptomonas paramecium" /LENGTH=266 /DNA_ID=CAMNT_0000610935 /DNA_START=9 /DNA_END=806 /DNA_ORIENTATION=- /assembly_acc=CAM_ASM_000170
MHVSQQFLTIAADGMVMFWDMRVKKKDDKSGVVFWLPIYRIAMNSSEGSTELSGTLLSLDPAPTGDRASWFYCGTEDGELVCGSWVKAEAANPFGNKEEEEGGKSGSTFVQNRLRCQYGPVVALQKSPFFDDVLLTVGDWTFNVFKMGDGAEEGGVETPVLVGPYSKSYLTCGRFSPTRPGVFVIGRADGRLEVWDLLDHSNQAAVEHALGTDAVTAIEFWSDPGGGVQLLAVGDDKGTLHILEIPRSLRVARMGASHVKALLMRE